MSTIGICHRCTRGTPAVGGKLACPVDGRDILEHAAAGECPKGLYAVPLTVRGVAHGAAGIAKAVAGAGGASEELVKSRTGICSTCEHGEMRAGVFHRCKLCGCSTWAKVRNADEKCPAGKW